MQTIICTGITGSDRLGCLEATKEYARAHGRDLRIIDSWEIAQEVSKRPVDEATILNQPEADRQRIFKDVYLEISRRLERDRQNERPNQEKSVVVATHATFLWRSTYIKAFPENLLNPLRPDLFITITHDMERIKSNLDSDAHRRFREITLTDVLYWRDREVTETLSWVQKFKKKYFLISHNEPPETLYGVLFRPRAKKIYASYPMSHVSKRQTEAAGNLVVELRKRGFVVFDPGSLNDVAYVDRVRGKGGRGEGKAIERTKKQMQTLLEIVGDQTVKTDYLLIDQSDLVVVYYPSVTQRQNIKGNGKVATSVYVPLSAGVICEMVHGFHSGKRVYAIWLPQDTPSPFFRYHCERIFGAKKQLLAYLERYYGQ